MKILWLKSDFLHPTTRGGQIRTLEMLRQMHLRHEIHYVGFENPVEPEGFGRSSEYCTRAYPIEHRAPRKYSLGFYAQLAANVVSPVPLVIARQQSAAMERTVADLLRRESFDSFVCDFLTPAINVPQLSDCVLFQHNVETMIWRRHVEHSGDPLRRAYFQLQADRMLRFEREVCHSVGRVIAVSENDSVTMQNLFGLSDVPYVPTGVDIESLTPPAEKPAEVADMVFVGSMDWLPNIDGMRHFVQEVLPHIRRRRPECSVAIVGRSPSAEVRSWAERDARITVTGTVPDVRPYLWGGLISIVPLRIGGGTRLKIYESMAAKLPVVATTVGAEGLEIHPPFNIRIADTAEAFAEECLSLLEDRDARRRVADEAWEMVSSRFSWDQVSRRFESILENSPRPQTGTASHAHSTTTA